MRRSGSGRAGVLQQVWQANCRRDPGDGASAGASAAALAVAGNSLAYDGSVAPSNLPTGFLSTLMSTLGILVLAKSAFAFLAGWGLMQRERGRELSH